MRLQNYIDGQFAAPANGAYLPNVAPATGEVYGEIPDSGAEDVERAITAAKKAFPMWSNLTAAERSAHMLRVSQRIEERLDELAAAFFIEKSELLKMATKKAGLNPDDKYAVIEWARGQLS